MELLTKRKEIKDRIEGRRTVISSWEYFFKGRIVPPGNNPQIASGGKIEGSVITSVAKRMLDPLVQFQIGGAEYLAMVRRVEGEVLKPLTALVDNNMNAFMPSGKGGNILLNSAFEKTAATCPKKPSRFFDGELSLD